MATEPLPYVPPDELPEAQIIPAQLNQWSSPSGPYAQPAGWQPQMGQYGFQGVPQSSQYGVSESTQFSRATQYPPPTELFTSYQSQYVPQPGIQSQSIPYAPLGQLPASIGPQSTALTTQPARIETLPSVGKFVPGGGCNHVRSTKYGIWGAYI